MKKWIIAATVLMIVGIIGMAVSLPSALREQVDLLNEVMQTEITYIEEKLPENIKVLDVNNQLYSGYRMITIKQSPDKQVHIKTFDNGNIEVTKAITSIEGDTAKISFDYQKNKDWALNREQLKKIINAELKYEDEVILEVPEEITILMDDMANVGLNIQNAKFANINEYNQARNERERLQEEIVRLQEELNNQNSIYEQEYSNQVDSMTAEMESMLNQINELTAENQRLQEELNAYAFGSEAVTTIQNEAAPQVVEEEIIPKIDYSIGKNAQIGQLQDLQNELRRKISEKYEERENIDREIEKLQDSTDPNKNTTIGSLKDRRLQLNQEIINSLEQIDEIGKNIQAMQEENNN